MTYARLGNNTVVEYPVYEGDIRLRFKETSFSFPFEPPNGYVSVADVTPPEITYLQNLTDGTPELVNGVWTRVWIVSPATAEEIEERTKAKAAGVRRDRQNWLVRSDWTQLPDASVDSDTWGAYRDALRRVPEQEGFPWSVEWPSEPGPTR
jgi:hypothetical protein